MTKIAKMAKTEKAELIHALIHEVLSLNPKCGELGEGRCLNMQELAKRIRECEYQ